MLVSLFEISENCPFNMTELEGRFRARSSWWLPDDVSEIEGAGGGG